MVESAEKLSSAELAIPRIEEQLEVGKEKTVTGRVLIHKTVVERAVQLETALDREDVTVERIACDRVVGGPQPTRVEGETTIIPVVEEVLVVEKRLVLKEEIRVTRRRRTVQEPQTATVRAEAIEIERQPGDSGLSPRPV